jgi:hypothetical protein
MTIIDLCEIGTSKHQGSVGERFEMFAADFLRTLGLEILEGPDRGADDGRDLIASESLSGSLSRRSIRWLVSVKHFAHSGDAVSNRAEERIRDRVNHFNADGFLAFYSTIPTASLGRHLAKLRTDGLRVEVFDGARICQELIAQPALWPVMRQYLPISYRRSIGAPPPLVLMTERGLSLRDDPQTPLPLQDLLALGEDGNVKFSDRRLEDLATACVLADALFRGKFELLRHFISFRPVVWRTLALILTWGPVNGALLADEIRNAESPAYLRLLISIAGEVRTFETVEPICARCLSAGGYYSKAVKDFNIPATPFYDVVRNTLAQMPVAVIPVIEEYIARARAQRRWQQKQVFEWALTRLQRRLASSAVNHRRAKEENRRRSNERGLALIAELLPPRWAASPKT